MSSKKSKPYDYGDLKKTVSGWLSEAETSREKTLASTIAKMSATGAKPGSPYWESQLKRVEEQYKSNLKDIYGTETYKLVEEHEQMQEIKKARAQEKFLAAQELEKTGLDPILFKKAGIDIDSVKAIQDFQQQYFGEMGMIGDNTPNKIWWEGGL